VPLRIAHKPGASGLVGVAEMATTRRATDDFVFVTSLSTLAASVQGKGDITLDELVPLGRLFQEYPTIYVRADSPFQSIADAITALREDPGSVKVGGGPVGTPGNLALARLVTAAGIDFKTLTYIPLEGGEGQISLLGGNLDLLSDGPEVMQLVESGQLR